MAKKIIKTPTKSSKASSFNLNIPHWVYILLLALSIIIFFWGAISGGGFGSSDNIASQSFKTFLDKAAEKGDFPLWIPNIFSGMPGYEALLLTGERVWDIPALILFGIADFFGQIFGSDVARVGFYYILYGIGIYFLVLSKGKDRFAAFMAGFAAMFSTAVIVWIMIGHNTKPVVFAFLPYIFLSVEKLRERFSLLYFVLLTYALHIMMEGAHIQMIFYSVLAIGVYLLLEIISRAIQKSELKNTLVATGLLFVAGGLAFAMSSDRYLATLDYTPNSTRGSGPMIQNENDHNAKSIDGGNPYKYATDWSFSPGEMMTFVVPNYYGFGELDYDSNDPKYTNTTLGNISNQIGGSFRSYWGQKPFEDVAPYMGIFILILGIFGAIRNKKDVFVQALIVISLISLFLSFGRTLPFLFDIFYNFVPNFNKFRAPSMSLALLEFAIPVLAAYGLSDLFKMRGKFDENKKTIYILLGSLASIFVIALLFGTIFKGLYIGAIDVDKFIGTNAYIFQQIPQELVGGIREEYKTFIFDSAFSDFLQVGIISVIFAGLIFLFIKEKINKEILIASTLILLVFDLWSVGYRPNRPNKEKANEAIFATPDWADYIKQDKSKFRVADFVSQSANVTAYYMLESVNGYHSAKLRLYQDLLDVAANGQTNYLTYNPLAYKVLNVKYVIDRQQYPGYEVKFQSPSGALVMQNPDYLQRAYFAKSVQKEDLKTTLLRFDQDPNNDFNPQEIAYMAELPSAKIDAPAETDKVSITNYENERIVLKANSSGNNLLVLSEIYYEPGWKAYIDGKETKIYRTDFAIRSVVVPQGEHKIEFIYDSPSFETGKTLSTITNVLMVLALLGGAFLEFRKRKASK